MTAVNILLAVLGTGITLMVGVGMILLTPGGAEDHPETPDLAHPETPDLAHPDARDPEAQPDPAVTASG